MGISTVVFPRLDFAEASDPQEGYECQEMCRVTIPPSPHPVYLRGSKGKGETELWVRVGSSTRRPKVTDATQYASTRRPESVRVSPQTRVRLLALRRREVPTRLPGVVGRAFTERVMSGSSAVEEE